LISNRQDLVEQGRSWKYLHATQMNNGLTQSPTLEVHQKGEHERWTSDTTLLAVYKHGFTYVQMFCWITIKWDCDPINIPKNFQKGSSRNSLFINSNM